MKTFFFKVFFFIVPLAVMGLLVFLFEGGYSDSYYLRLTTPRQKGLVIGTSRAAQGIDPDVVSKNLSSIYPDALYNYAFTVTHSPYGGAYLRSISNKLDPTTEDGLFIVTIDPWSLCVKNEQDGLLKFSETGSFIDGMDDVSTNPNFIYLLKYYDQPFFNIIWKRLHPGNLRLHSNGWLEVSTKLDSISVEKRKTRQLRRYKKRIKKLQFSEARLEALKQVIEFLQKFGDVYLVRLPVQGEMYALESSLLANFTEEIQSITRVYQVPYFDMTPLADRYTFNDGHHIHKTSSHLVSEDISKWILDMKKNDTISNHYPITGR